MPNRDDDLTRKTGRVLAAVTLVALAVSPARSLAAPDDGPSDAERRRIEDTIERNVARLQAEGKLAPPTEGSVLFGWPLRAANGLSDFGNHVITRFVDHDPAFPGALLDYNCGDRTGDWATVGNHRGTDIEIWPFPWLKMERDEVEVVSAAPGTIVCRQDGYTDFDCNCNSLSWNVVCVRHADGSTIWYGHLKQGSVTPKGVGASVSAGEYLGVVGSSGCSSVPHLHLEVYDAFGYLQDPFQGPCNGTTAETRWLDQRPYNDSAVNRILTSSSAPAEVTGCPGTVTLNEQTVFNENQWIFFTTYFRDFLAGQVATYELRKPDLSIHSTWTYEIAAGVEHESKVKKTHLRWIWDTFVPSGEWLLDVHFEGEVYSKSFLVNGPPAPMAAGRLGPDLRLGKPTLDGLPLTWTPSSCNPADTSYAIVTGLIGNWNNHGFVTCQTADTFFPVPLHLVAGNRYYLVAPRSVNAIGSYGLDSAGDERPPGVNNCDLPHLIYCSGEE